ncbi:ABC transporter substrate-binding protein [Aquamicrobium terrae]
MKAVARMLALAGTVAMLGIGAAHAADKLTIGVRAAATSIDPHYHLLNPNKDLAAHMFDGLTAMDQNVHLKPSLAISWRLIDDQTWEFKLREGVKFHNGNAFTADDVAFTIDRVPNVANSPGSYAVYTKRIKSVEVVDDYTVRFTTDGVYPLLPIDLSMVFMLDRETHEGLGTEDFNSGKGAIGTGPYRFVSFQRGDRVKLERNDDYWGGKPEWDEVTLRVISNDASRLAALLAGDVDIIDAVPTTDLERLRNEARVKIWDALSMRAIFLWIDHHQAEGATFVSGPNGEKFSENVLRNLKVRQALSMAINRDAIVERLMQGAAAPTGQFLPEGAFGYDPGISSPAFDAEGAKRLLAEAGYPDGLRITLHGPNDRYVNDSRIIQAIGQMWERIGVTTKVEPEPWSAYIGRMTRGDFSIGLLSVGTSTGEASNPLRSVFATTNPDKGLGASNYGGYSNPEMDVVVEKAMGTTDDAAREALLREATRLVMDDVAVVPLHIQKSFWASKPDLALEARRDESTRAMEVHRKK